MKKVLLLFIILLSYIVFSNVKKLSEPNDIDILEQSLREVKELNIPSNKIYFISNNNSRKKYFLTQFLLAPKIIINSNSSKIPSESYILILKEKKHRKKKLRKIFNIKDTLLHRNNENYEIFILKKQV